MSAINPSSSDGLIGVIVGSARLVSAKREKLLLQEEALADASQRLFQRLL
jgi:hypothetical protein